MSNKESIKEHHQTQAFKDFCNNSFKSSNNENQKDSIYDCNIIIDKVVKLNNTEKLFYYSGTFFELFFGAFLIYNFDEYQYKMIAYSAIAHATFVYQ
jgi:hypothetical protein